jgi:AraC-like DNA-binding protein
MLPDESKMIDCVTIMFTYIGFYRLFGVPMKELYGSIYNLSDVKLPGFKEIIAKIEDSADNTTRTDILNKYFEKQFILMDTHDNRYIYLQRIISYIMSKKGKLNVCEVCEHTCMTERSLQNWFKVCIGTSPREFIHIIRFQNLINEIYSNNVSNIDWQEIIHDYRYYDQSHLDKLFKEATSVTPEYFIKNKKSKLFLASNGSGCLFFSDIDNSGLLKENTLKLPEK